MNDTLKQRSNFYFIPQRSCGFLEKIIIVCCALAFGLFSQISMSQDVPGCGNLANATGPYNYVTQKSQLGIVETYHFTPEVEQLKRGKSSYLYDDLDYTLRAYPNHHRALQSFDRWELKQLRKNQFFKSPKYTADCYFKRAVAFAPTDAVVHLLYGIHFAKRDQNSEAEREYLKAIDNNKNLTDAYYNLGLLYVDQKKYTEALEYAKIAYSRGHPLPGLRNRLVEAGQWDKK